MGRSSLGLGEEVSASSGGRVCHFDVVLSKNFLQGFGECGVEGWGDVEGEVWSLFGGLLKFGRGEVSAVCFVHNST